MTSKARWLILTAVSLVFMGFVACATAPEQVDAVQDSNVIATQDFTGLTTADLEDGDRIASASWAGDGSFIAVIEDDAFFVTYTDAGNDPGHGGWWWSDNNAAFVGTDWIPQSELPGEMAANRAVRVDFEYFVNGTVGGADGNMPALIMFKPVGQSGGAIEYADYDFGPSFAFEIAPGEYHGNWNSGSVEFMLGQVNSSSDDWYTGVALSFEFQGADSESLTIGVDNISIVGE